MGLSRRLTGRTKPSRPRMNAVNETAPDACSRPTFKQWLRVTSVDLLSLGVTGSLALAIFRIPPVPLRLFPIHSKHGDLTTPGFAYPRRKQIIPIWLSALLSLSIPVATILLMQIRVRSFWDANDAITGLLSSLINAALFQVVLKVLIGGLRPHFLAACAPDASVVAHGRGAGFEGIMFDRSVCTGDDRVIDDALTSWPSGHSTAAFAGFGFLFLYLNAKLDARGDRRRPWEITLLYAPILGATLICGSLVIDASHNWYDVVTGAAIGSMMAVSSFGIACVGNGHSPISSEQGEETLAGEGV